MNIKLEQSWFRDNLFDYVLNHLKQWKLQNIYVIFSDIPGLVIIFHSLLIQFIKYDGDVDKPTTF